MKTYVLMISKTFPAHHPRKGESTYFAEKIHCKIPQTLSISPPIDVYPKLHTIRENYSLWKKRIDKINAGEAILSLRQWTDKPYKSKQIEILQLRKVGIQKVDIQINKIHFKTNDSYKLLLQLGEIKVDGKEIKNYRAFYANDGLFDKGDNDDFINWFGPGDHKDMAVIHFTDLIY